LFFAGVGVANFDFEIPAAFNGDVCMPIVFSGGEFLNSSCFLGAGVGACSASIGEFAGCTGVVVNGFITIACAAADVDDGVCFGVLRIPPFLDGDLKEEALAASC
jgi:hypothetical protein